VKVALTKTITPSAAKPIPAGGRSIAQLKATTDADSGFVHPTTVVIQDLATGAAGDYWGAFDIVAVAPTQVPAGAALTVATTTDGTTWTTVDSVPASASAVYYQSVLAGASNLTGVRLTFTDTDGFAQASTLQANLAFVARATIRGTAESTAGSGTATYTNAASATAIGDVVIDGEGPVTATASSSGTAVIKQLAGGSGGMIAPSKSWNVATVNTQSGDSANATVRWGTEVSGYANATVTEPADPSAAVSSTVFQAFNLTRINAITTATDPLIAYDRVTKVELFTSGAAQPTDITSKVCTTAAACQGRMPAYSLSAGEQASTVGVRITFAEWAGGRTTDPLAPPVGSGVASGPDSRAVTFVFQLRNTLRDASGDPARPWVTGSRSYNDTDPGVVANTAAVALDAQTGTASADILVLDTTPGVALTKTVGPTAVAIPVAGDIPDAAYPSTVFTLTANNTAPAKA
jgi:hypothetical protein